MPALIAPFIILASLCLTACLDGTDAAQNKTSSAAPPSPFAYSFRNPYYSATSWKLWFEDGTPVGGVTLPRSGDIYSPQDPDPARPGLYMNYRKAGAANNYAGFQDDVYVSQDNNHSFMPNTWTGLNGNSISGIISGMVTATLVGPVASTLGANFTSQSTTGMGHDIANFAAPVIANEQFYYFADCLRAGPAHVSYMDRTPTSSTDEYQALVPSLYNSVGSSGSEVAALAKLTLAAGYLPRDVKRNMKRAGIYPASLLYIWKAALPYQVPYDDELRHRVAYYSLGDHSDYTGSNQTEYNFYYHQYDDNLHMKNMLQIAKSMVYPPPVAILKKVGITGGTVVNDTAKTSWLVQQAAGVPVTINVSPTDSYDIYKLPLTYRMKLLYGDPKTVIIQDPTTQDFRIFVPGTARLPRGRTTVVLIANNGYFDSNPAAINIYRTSGPENRRPVMRWPSDRTLLPGETFSATLSGTDPEGFPVRLSQWSGEVGVLAGSNYTWNIPPAQADGDHKVHFIASDGTAGNSQESKAVLISVRSTVAELTSDITEGAAPLTVRFNAAGSRDKAGGTLSYAWDFDDGNSATSADPAHLFAEPGYYRVKLTVTGASGSHSTTTIIHASQQWKLRLKNGWNATAVDPLVWNRIDPRTPVSIGSSDGSLLLSSYDGSLPTGAYGLTSVAGFSPPLYFEAEYRRSQNEVPGSGFQVLDAVLGFTAATGNTSRNEYIAAPDGDGGLTGQYIAERVRDNWINSKIRLYVAPDPNHPGRYRYQGVLLNEWGTALIRLDNRPPPATNKIKLINSEPRYRIDLFSAKVFAP